MSKYYPFRREVKFMNTFNEAIAHDVKFYVYRSEFGKVEKFEVLRMTMNVYTGVLSVEYRACKGMTVSQAATTQDLQLFTDRAKQLQQAASAGKERFEIVRK